MHLMPNLSSRPAMAADLARQIVETIFSRRRLLPDQGETSFECEAEPHLAKVHDAIRRQRPVRLVLPAFPAKSPSRLKTLSHLPDHGEELALISLSALADRIAELYPPGAQILICSDGRVFADVVRIPDPDVTAYNRALRDFAAEQGLNNLEFFDLDDVYPQMSDYVALREELLILYGEPLTTLQQRCRTEAEAVEMYRGITRFVFEDFLGLPDFAGQSRNAVQRLARASAYRVIQRSNAWGRLLADRFGDAVRLSIHPQFRRSEKIGVNLIDGGDCWATPWHAVVLKRGDQVSLVQRWEAESMDANLVFKNGRPSYFQTHEAALPCSH